jgi:hypothetical protein
VVSILFSHSIYNTIELYNAFAANDIVNLILGVTILFLVMWLIRKNKAIGLFCLSGNLLFVIYNHIAYMIASRNIYSYIANSLILILAIISIVLLNKTINGKSVYVLLNDILPRKTFGSLIIGLGLVFLIRSIIGVINHYNGQALLTIPELAVNISDMFVCSFWVVMGVLLLAKKHLGYSTIIGIYFQASFLFVGLILFLILNPIVCNVKFSAADLITIAIMSLICIIPFGFIVNKVKNL